MVKAILHNGAIQPLSPLPENWSEGQELVVEEAVSPAERKDWDTWSREVDALASKVASEDFERLEAALAEADQRAKEQVWQRMRLS